MINLEQRQNINQYAVASIFSNRVDSVLVSFTQNRGTKTMVKLEQRQHINQHAVVSIFTDRLDSVTVILISTKTEITLMSDTTLKRLNIRMVEERLCCHRMTIYRWYTAGTFPKPHYLGQNRLWLEAQVEEWERKQLLEHNSGADTFYTMSGTSPPSVTSSTSSKGGEK